MKIRMKQQITSRKEQKKTKLNCLSGAFYSVVSSTVSCLIRPVGRPATQG